MTWGWYTRDSDNIPRDAFVCAVVYGNNVAHLQTARDELRRHMNIYPVHSPFPGVFTEHDAERTSSQVDEVWRQPIFGMPYRSLNLGRLRRQLVTVRGLPVRLVVGNTGASSWVGFQASELFSESGTLAQAADSFGQAGQGVVDAVSGAGPALGSIGAGLRDGLPEAGAGVGDALRGAGGALSGVGATTRGLGAFTSANPVTGTVLLVALAGGAFWAANRAGLLKGGR